MCFSHISCCFESIADILWGAPWPLKSTASSLIAPSRFLIIPQSSLLEAVIRAARTTSVQMMIKGCKKYIIGEMGFTQWALYAVTCCTDTCFFFYTHGTCRYRIHINSKCTLIWVSSIFVVLPPAAQYKM